MVDVADGSSRVFVSGLPPALNSDQLAAHFRNVFKVTDAHIFPSRRIGFVGFEDHQTAQKAVTYFNRSYVRMSRISVDLARPVESKHKLSGRTLPTIQNDRNVRQSNEAKAERTGQAAKATGAESRVPSEGFGKRKRENGDDGEAERTQPVHKSNEQDMQPEIARGTPDTAPREREEEHILASDRDWLRGKTNRLLDLVDVDVRDSEPIAAQENRHEADTNPKPPSVTTTADLGAREINNIQKVSNARLFIRNLAFDVTTDDILEKFRVYGKIQEAHIVKDARKGLSKGMGFVQFAQPEHAENAMGALDGTDFYGRLLHLLPASDKRQQKLTDFEISKLPLKQQKAMRRKRDATTATFSWNSLYMNPDAVIASIASRLGVAKSEVLDPTSADAAVKQAHAETQLIAETKEYLKSRGLSPAAFSNKARDEKTLLLKNFPFGTEELELKELLDPFGPLDKLIVPPAGTMAIAEFVDSHSATQALKGLAYKNIKGAVLYLEKAPLGLMSSNLGTAAQVGDDDELRESQVSDLLDTNLHGNVATIFVRNLNFVTSTSRMKEVFSPLSGFRSARVKTRVDPKRPGEILSMGFGFVEFTSRAHAEAAITAMNGHRLDGHELLIKLSTKSNDVAEERRQDDHAKKADTHKTKIIIKNLPFQASKKDITALFSPYGQLKKVRVPKKLDNTSRGFGFAEFVTTREAESAMEALTNTHLLGRRLVLEFTQQEAIDPDAEIRMIEKKVEQQSNRINLSKISGTGRKKFNVHTGDDGDL